MTQGGLWQLVDEARRLGRGHGDGRPLAVRRLLEAPAPEDETAELADELAAAQDAMTTEQWQWLTGAAGVTPRALIAAHLPGVVRVWPGMGTTYLPGDLDDGRAFDAVILGVWSQPWSLDAVRLGFIARLEDLVVWNPRDPSRWWLRLGAWPHRPRWLGEWNVLMARGLGLDELWGNAAFQVAGL